MKQRHPMASALAIFGFTVGVTVVACYVAGIVAYAFSGDLEQATWGSFLVLVLLTPVALLVGAKRAIARYRNERRRQAEEAVQDPLR